MLSIIIPAYNEEENIVNTASVIGGIMKENSIEFEIIFIDDGSKDKTWEITERLAAEENSFVRGVKFSRNFGKEAAIFAGLKACSGDCAAVMDCDLQHPPQLLTQMYEMWKNGAQVVEAKRAARGRESLAYRICAKTFYRFMEKSSDISMEGDTDYKLMDRQVIDALNELPERITFYRGLSSWVGFKTERIEFEPEPRHAGKSKWGFKKLFKYALNNITSFTNAPLQFITAAGILCFCAGIIYGIVMIILQATGHPQTQTSALTLIVLFISAVLMWGMGIIGYYLSKIYYEIKARPRYIISKDTKYIANIKEELK